MQMCSECSKCQQVGVDTEPRDDAERTAGGKGDVSELFACERVGQVHLDVRSLQHCSSIADRHTCVGPCGRVEHETLDTVSHRVVQPGEECRLVVGLAHLDM